MEGNTSGDVVAEADLRLALSALLRVIDDEYPQSWTLHEVVDAVGATDDERAAIDRLVDAGALDRRERGWREA